MNYIFELSKQHKTIPKSEVLACLNSEKITYKIVEINENAIIIQTDAGQHKKIKKLADRLSFTFYIDQFLFPTTTNSNEIKKHALQNPIKEKGSIAVKYLNRSENIDSQKIVKTLAEIYSKNRTVTLEKPDIEIRALITNSKVYIGIKKTVINRTQYEKRKVQHRPFFSPISLHPKIARALVNLSLVKKGDKLLDPFCGTGGILIEAGLIGIKIIGNDIEDKMIKGCEKNLDFYGIKNYKLYCSDIKNIRKKVGKVNAVVTDLPYGKATTTKGEDIKQLYNRAFEIIHSVLKKQGIAVIGLSNKDMLSIGEKHFSLLEIHSYRVHRSLTRYFPVFQK